jgi:hypothetical protein
MVSEHNEENEGSGPDIKQVGRNLFNCPTERFVPVYFDLKPLVFLC